MLQTGINMQLPCSGEIVTGCKNALTTSNGLQG